MDEASIGNARCTEVPVGAVEALVTNTVNVLFIISKSFHNRFDAVIYLVTSITDSIVANVTAWSEQSLGDEVKLGLFDSRLESMLGVVAMLHADMAGNAEIKVGARSAGDEVLLGEF